MTISKELPELTPRQQKIFDLWDSMSIIEIGTAMNKTSGAVTAQARFVRAKGYALSNKRDKEQCEQIRSTVEQLQRTFRKHGESTVFDKELLKAGLKFGFKEKKRFHDMVRAHLGRHKIDGTVGEYLRGNILGHSYTGVRPSVLFGQLWNRELVI